MVRLKLSHTFTRSTTHAKVLFSLAKTECSGVRAKWQIRPLSTIRSTLRRASTFRRRFRRRCASATTASTIRRIPRCGAARERRSAVAPQSRFDRKGARSPLRQSTSLSYKRAPVHEPPHGVHNNELEEKFEVRRTPLCGAHCSCLQPLALCAQIGARGQRGSPHCACGGV